MGATMTAAEIRAVTDNAPGRLRFVQRTGTVHVFRCVEHNHSDYPQFYATRPHQDRVYGPAATIAAAIRLAVRTDDPSPAKKRAQ